MVQRVVSWLSSGLRSAVADGVYSSELGKIVPGKAPRGKSATVQSQGSSAGSSSYTSEIPEMPSRTNLKV